MSTPLSQQDREFLEQLTRRKVRPTKRQKADALLNFARGVTLEEIAEQTGIARDELAGLLQMLHFPQLHAFG